eukprot:gene9867-biopygen8124
MAIDHFGEIIVQGGIGSKLEKMKLHRTKCSSLIKNVVSPALHADLCEDMAGEKYCAMIDESTDVACLKYLCVAARFFSKKERKIVTAFVGLIPVVSATGKDLFGVMKACLEASSLKMSDMVGFGCDGASAMAAQLEGDAQVRYKARMIADMLRDPVNLLYFHFLSPIVAEFERVNAFFQATNIDPHDMMKELSLFSDSLKSRVFGREGAQLPLTSVDFGAKFLFEADALVSCNNGDDAVLMKVMEAKKRCHNMLLETANQVKKRLPPSSDIFQALGYLHPSRVLSQTDRVLLQKLPMQHLMADKLTEIDNQYRKVFLVNWSEEPMFKEGIPKESVPFWSGVLRYQNSALEYPFADLATYALSCLTTPTSNAVVERIFSYVTNVKTKQRNRMGTTMLEAIVRIRTRLHFGEKCCKDFVPSQRMLSLFNSETMYPSAMLKKTDEDEIDDLADCVL